MAQATESHITNRRKFLVGASVAAVVSTAAVLPALGAEPEISPELLLAGAKIKVAFLAVETAYATVRECEARMADWRKRNPEPDSGHPKYQVEEYWTVFNADKNEWLHRSMNALQRSGVGAAKKIHLDRVKEFDEAICAFALIAPTSMPELLFMARIGRKHDTASGILAWSIVDDLVEMLEEQSHG